MRFFYKYIMKYKYLNEVLLNWNSEEIQNNSIIKSSDIKEEIEKNLFEEWESIYFKEQLSDNKREIARNIIYNALKNLGSDATNKFLNLLKYINEELWNLKKIEVPNGFLGNFRGIACHAVAYLLLFPGITNNEACFNWDYWEYIVLKFYNIIDFKLNKSQKIFYDKLKRTCYRLQDNDPEYKIPRDLWGVLSQFKFNLV